MSDPAKPESALAKRALALLDLTNLDDSCTQSAVDSLCAKATGPHGPVAAICVWPQFVHQARDRLAGTSVRIATVINFPEGGEDIERCLEDVRQSLADGADELDLVLPYGALVRGDSESAREMVAALREEIEAPRLLKVILETGRLAEPALIEAASRLALDAGADFLKTSTGKSPVSATPEAARIMLEAIRDSGRAVGLKPSGGIRTLADARLYLSLADEIMGPAWVSPATFRFGASGLYDALVATIEGGSARAGGSY